MPHLCPSADQLTGARWFTQSHLHSFSDFTGATKAKRNESKMRMRSVDQLKQMITMAQFCEAKTRLVLLWWCQSEMIDFGVDIIQKQEDLNKTLYFLRNLKQNSARLGSSCFSKYNLRNVANFTKFSGIIEIFTKLSGTYSYNFQPMYVFIPAPDLHSQKCPKHECIILLWQAYPHCSISDTFTQMKIKAKAIKLDMSILDNCWKRFF